MKRFLKAASPFLTLLVAFYLDGIVKYNFNFLNSKNNNGLPQFMLMVLVIFAFKLDINRELLIYSFVFGFMYDIYYMNIFGVYLVILPLTIMGIFLIKNIIQDSIIIEVSIYLLSLIGIHLIVYILGLIFKTIDLNFVDFITYIIFPTTLFNLLMIIFLVVPLNFWIYKVIQYRREF